MLAYTIHDCSLVSRAAAEKALWKVPPSIIMVYQMSYTMGFYVQATQDFSIDCDSCGPINLSAIRAQVNGGFALIE
jgi:hypothetical protein